MGPRAIQEFVERCSTLGLISVLDGSIDEADIASLAPSRPDYIVFRRGAIALHHSPYELDAKRIESIMYGIARLQTTDGEGGRTLVDPARTPRVAVRIRRDADIAIVRAERVDRIDFCGEFVFDESTPLDGDEVRSIEISHADLGKSRRLLHDARADQIFVDLRNLDPESLDSFLVGHPDLTDAGHVAVIALSQGLSCIPALAAAGFMGAMLAAEDGTRLLVNRSTIALVSQFVELSRNAGLESHLRGGLEAPDLPRLETALPDVLHFDEGVRTDGALDPVKIASIRSLAIRRPGKPVKNFDASTKTDRIVVKDMIVDMQIGAYDFERGKTQKVSFSVEVDVARTSEMPSHLCDIYSYDLVMDGVRSLVDRGHTDLVETLAEELAAIVLDHPRAVRAHVSVEKLELGPGRCGIQIVRPD
jgi:dihydroneopterin aldolase